MHNTRLLKMLTVALAVTASVHANESLTIVTVDGETEVKE